MNNMCELTRDESNQIEELLKQWYAWQADYTPGLGHGRIDPSCRGFEERSRDLSADERAEEADRKAARRRAEQVDMCVDGLQWQERAAIQRHMKARRVGAMNRACDAMVWSCPRGFDQADAHALYQRAKRSLLPMLKRRGLIEMGAQAA